MVRSQMFTPLITGGLVLLAALTFASPAAAAPGALQSDCPIASTDLVSGAVGQPVQSDEMMMSSLGSRDECIFGNDEGIVLVGRVAGFFGSAGPEAMDPANLQQLTRTSQELMFTPEAGVGDSATWAEAADPAIRAERLAVLIVRHGADAYFFGVDQSAFQDSRSLTITLASSVIAANP